MDLECGRQKGSLWHHNMVGSRSNIGTWWVHNHWWCICRKLSKNLIVHNCQTHVGSLSANHVWIIYGDSISVAFVLWQSYVYQHEIYLQISQLKELIQNTNCRIVVIYHKSVQTDPDYPMLATSNLFSTSGGAGVISSTNSQHPADTHTRKNWSFTIPPTTRMVNVWNSLCIRGISGGVASCTFTHHKSILC